jgi:DNA-binding transcriptional ArsR family regulator
MRLIYKKIFTIFAFLNKQKKMEIKNQILDAIKKAGEPVNAGKVVELTKLDRKEVDKGMKMLKDEGLIVSPKRCFWEAK